MPGVAAAAQSEEETLELMREAMEFHLEGRADGNSQKHNSTLPDRASISNPSDLPFIPCRCSLENICRDRKCESARPAASIGLMDGVLPSRQSG